MACCNRIDSAQARHLHRSRDRIGGSVRRGVLERRLAQKPDRTVGFEGQGAEAACSYVSDAGKARDGGGDSGGLEPS